MPVPGTVTKRHRRAFSPELKAEVVRLCHQPAKTVASVPQELKLGETALRRRVHQAEADAGRERAPPAPTRQGRSTRPVPAPVGQRQLLAVWAASCCSTSSPSIMIWTSSLTTHLPSNSILKVKPKSFLFIWVRAL